MLDILTEMEKKDLLGKDNLSMLKSLCEEINISLWNKIEDGLKLFGKTEQTSLFPIVILEVMYKYCTALIMNALQAKKRCSSQRNRGAAQDTLRDIWCRL